jgi:two-component system OmpR family sensor kinase
VRGSRCLAGQRKIARVSNERLTRHEITWLLAQEARGAAKTLRDEVVKVQRQTGSEPAPEPVETTLDALDDAIAMLSALNTGSRGNKARRGRIDLAALLYEVAPSARIAIEPGAGTEVFGDEADLRRMVNLLVTQAAAGASQPEVRIRRQTDWVRISVDLGPDVAATGELERRWLSRMATRHGGWFELEGGTQSILLQADGASDQREVHELRQELKQAQELGEAYARELATVLVSGEVKTEPPPQQATQSSAAFDALRGAAAAFERIVKASLDALRVDVAAAAKLHPNSELSHSLARRALSLGEVAGELALIAESQTDEPPAEIDLVAACRAALGATSGRASRHDIAIDVSLPERLLVRSAPSTLELLLKLLMAHAVAATPRGGVVRLSVYATELGAAIAIEDGGPPVPEALRSLLLRYATDPAKLGRPTGFALLAAHSAAIALGSELTLRDGTHGATEAWLTLPLSS